MTWTLPGMLERHASERAGSAAVRDGERAVSWGELASMAGAASAGLRARGVRPGDRVALRLPPSTESIAVLAGVLRIGAVVAPVPAGLTARELGVALGVLAPTLVVGPDDLTELTGGGAVKDDIAEAAFDTDPETPAVVVMTSGTTGVPKGVVLSSRALAASADAWLGTLPAATGWAMPLGLGHVAGLGVLWRAVRDGVPLTILPAADPTALLATLDAGGGPSHVSLVPGQLVRLLDAAGSARAPLGVRAVLLGGGRIPAALVVRGATGGWPVVNTYGLSEMGSGVTALPAEEALEAPGTAGRPLPRMSLAIEGAGADGVGEIVVRGPSRSSGYLGEPPVAATEPVHTRDLGRLDEAGRLVVVDRRTDRIVRGGENIDPGEVEAVLESHPSIAEAAVIARPDETWGQVPVAAIVARPEATFPESEALRAHARANLAGFKVPATFTSLDTLPRTAGGKLRRDAVRALLGGEAAGELARPG
ncbi:MAG: AMP-binding protein, partial [Candidatus Limnocylindrales bacterium]